MSSEIKVFIIDNSAVTRIEISKAIRKSGIGFVIGTAPREVTYPKVLIKK